MLDKRHVCSHMGGCAAPTLHDSPGYSSAFEKDCIVMATIYMPSTGSCCGYARGRGMLHRADRERYGGGGWAQASRSSYAAPPLCAPVSAGGNAYRLREHPTANWVERWRRYKERDPASYRITCPGPICHLFLNVHSIMYRNKCLTVV